MVSVFLSLVVVSLCLSLGLGWEVCAEDDPTAVCPTNNFCCAKGGDSGTHHYSCITQVEREPWNETLREHYCCNNGRGCGAGYKCSETGTFCVRTSENDPTKPAWLPQYKLCTFSSNPESLKEPQLLEVEPDEPPLLYYSSFSGDNGDVYNTSLEILYFLVVVHGSGANAEDYYCCGLSSVPDHLKNQFVVVSPWFSPKPDAGGNDNILTWPDHSSPIPHSFRYGADASNAPISSYEAMDRLVETAILKFPRLQNVIVAGHSAGGQFVHRWALMSGSTTVWDHAVVRVRVVAANPRSFCYLDDRRWRNSSFGVPSADRIKACPHYNSWEWGLALNDTSRLGPIPYVERTKLEVPYTDLLKRYAERDVWYLAGELDVLNVTAECEDDNFQGENRRVRSKLFYASLPIVYNGSSVHRRVVAFHVPHNHCLIFQSKAGQQAMYGNLLIKQREEFLKRQALTQS